MARLVSTEWMKVWINKDACVDLMNGDFGNSWLTHQFWNGDYAFMSRATEFQLSSFREHHTLSTVDFLNKLIQMYPDTVIEILVIYTSSGGAHGTGAVDLLRFSQLEHTKTQTWYSMLDMDEYRDHVNEFLADTPMEQALRNTALPPLDSSS